MENDPDFKQKMCCCQAASNFHNETSKFILLGENKNLNEPVFEPASMSEGKLEILHRTPRIASHYWPNKDRLYLFQRSQEIHTILEKICAKQKRIVYVQGPMGVGKHSIINEAIMTLFNRNHPAVSGGAVKVSLQSVQHKDSIVQRIA